MRDTVGMPAPLDPYRTLGVAPGASADEIRRAYRQLAKANHPDSAGEAALPRFLAIQTAYEMLITGATAGRRPAQGRAAPGRPAPGRPSARPAYSRRGGAAGGAGTRPGGGSAGQDPGDGGPAARDGGPTGTTGSTGRGSTSERPRRPGGRSRSPNKATLGSTSYDAAEDEPFEPDWSGGTWYGASSGTYWTINPKEYADPRKHGPEYQRRARRMIDGIDVDTTDEGPAIAGDDFTDADTETATGGPGRSRFDGRWTYPTTSQPVPGHPSSTTTPPRRGRLPPVDESARPPLSTVFDRLLGGQVGLGGRIFLAFVGWLPIGAGIAWLAGELTGCGRFTATCVDPSGIGTLIPSSRSSSCSPPFRGLRRSRRPAPLAALLVSVAVAVVLSAAGGSRQPGVSNVVIALVFVVGYVAGAAFAAGRKLGWRRVP